MNYIIVDHYTKIFRRKPVLSDICLTVPENSIMGFVGPNGSGKSMLFRAIAGLIHPTSGKIVINGIPLNKRMPFPPSLGIVIENVGLWPERNCMENLCLLAAIKNEIGRNQIENAIRRVGLEPDDKRPIKKYSLGMKQRLVIAQAIMEKPKLIILDEPTNALDEDAIKLIYNIILEERARGATILLSSHNKTDISTLCDGVIHMQNGKVVCSEIGVRI